jgi:hypothetical protein
MIEEECISLALTYRNKHHEKPIKATAMTKIQTGCFLTTNQVFYHLSNLINQEWALFINLKSGSHCLSFAPWQPCHTN